MLLYRKQFGVRGSQQGYSRCSWEFQKFHRTLNFDKINIYTKLEKVRPFTKNIFDVKITLNKVDEDQDSLLVEIMNFKIKNLKRPREKRAKK